MDLGNLNGPQRAVLRDAILSAFTKTSLDQLLQHNDWEPLESIVTPGRFPDQLFELVKLSQDEGWTAELVAALCAANPGNPKIKGLLDDLERAAHTGTRRRAAQLSAFGRPWPLRATNDVKGVVERFGWRLPPIRSRQGVALVGALILIATGIIATWLGTEAPRQTNAIDATAEPAIILQPEPAPKAAKDMMVQSPASKIDGEKDVAVLPPPIKKAQKKSKNPLTELTPAEGASWVSMYDGGPCFFASVTRWSDDQIFIQGIGDSDKPFTGLFDSVSSTFFIEPHLVVHLITRAQCPVAEFLKATTGSTVREPLLALNKDRISSGETLSATVDGSRYPVITIVMIDANGMALNLKSRAKSAIEGSKTVYTMTFVDPAAVDEPNLILVFGSATGLSVPEGKSIAGSELLDALRDEIMSGDEVVGIDFKYLKVEARRP
jgi:hypothetical protein